MQFSIQREVLLKPLQQVIGVVERRQTLPVLSNLLVVASPGNVTFTGTDLAGAMSASAATTAGSMRALRDAVHLPYVRELNDDVRSRGSGSIQFGHSGAVHGRR